MASSEERLDLLERCLDRRESINSLGALRRALDEGSAERKSDSRPIAFGLDTNSIFRLGADTQYTDAVDFLDTQHSGPLILPGQVLQEYWNSQLSALNTQHGVIKSKFRVLGDEVEKLDDSFGPFRERFESLIGEFASTYAFAFDPTVMSRIASLLEMLERRAHVSYVPRSPFREIAEARERTKTPPGFKDVGFGDFYVWADFLFGLLSLRDAGAAFQKAVLITADEKVDWSRGGLAHPILVAEVEQLLEVPFETWNLVAFREYVSEELASRPNTPDGETRADAEPKRDGESASQPIIHPNADTEIT